MLDKFFYQNSKTCSFPVGSPPWGTLGCVFQWFRRVLKNYGCYREILSVLSKFGLAEHVTIILRYCGSILMSTVPFKSQYITHKLTFRLKVGSHSRWGCKHTWMVFLQVFTKCFKMCLFFEHFEFQIALKIQRWIQKSHR